MSGGARKADWNPEKWVSVEEYDELSRYLSNHLSFNSSLNHGDIEEHT
jgi:hypothetical protein